MRKRKQSKLTIGERRLLKRVVLLVIVVGILWLVFAPGWGLLHYSRVHHQVETLARENADLAERNDALRKEIDKLHNDDAYLEELARQKYGMLKDNEKVYEFKSSGKKK